jgi:hypothetical protein
VPSRFYVLIDRLRPSWRVVAMRTLRRPGSPARGVVYIERGLLLAVPSLPLQSLLIISLPKNKVVVALVRSIRSCASVAFGSFRCIRPTRQPVTPLSITSILMGIQDCATIEGSMSTSEKSSIAECKSEPHKVIPCC